MTARWNRCFSSRRVDAFKANWTVVTGTFFYTFVRARGWHAEAACHAMLVVALSTYTTDATLLTVKLALVDMIKKSADQAEVGITKRQSTLSTVRPDW